MTRPMHKLTDANLALADTQALVTNGALALSHRTTQLQKLLNASLTRQSHCLETGMPAFMAMAKFDPDTLGEWFELQNAIADRFVGQGEQWIQGIRQIAEEAAELKKANTLGKYMAQQCALVGQWVSLLSTQTTNVTEQLENIQIDVAYWLSQKTGR